MKNQKPKPLCCEETCKVRPDWHVATGSGPDDYTHACTGHIGKMLVPGKSHFVTPFIENANG